MNTIRPCLAIFGNVFQTAKSQYVKSILSRLIQLGARVYVEERFAQFIREKIQADISACKVFPSRELPKADIAISIGGDGTFLGTAAQIGTSGIPILGINTGRLGFLADVSPDVIDVSLKALCNGEYVVEDRTVLKVSTNKGGALACPYALNEVAVLKHDNSSLIEISTRVDGNLLTNYLADGLIISTPTGSTGYSLSVGGPILAPDSNTLCIAPISPHSLSVRPVILRDDVEIKLKINSRTHNFLLTADGKSLSLPDSTTIGVCRSPHTVKVIKIAHKHFFETLRDKLLWGADQRF